MTGPTVRLEPETLSAEPGGQARGTLTIGNPGDIVEGYRLELLGAEVADFGTVSPAEIQVYPGQEASAVLLFSPPDGAAGTGGRLPFGVRVTSVVDSGEVTVVEGDLDVGRVFGLTARTVPLTSHGRWRGRHLVTVSNWGNAAVTLRVGASDPDENLDCAVLPDRLHLPVGASGVTRVAVRTRRPFLRGTPVRRPFSVTAEPDPPEPAPSVPGLVGSDGRRVVVDAAFTQRPILSRAVVTVSTVAVLLVGGGVAWALTRPTSETGNVLTTGIPDRPELTAVAAVDALTLRWTPQPGVDGYDLFPVIDGARGPLTALPGGQGVQVVTDVVGGTTYCYALQARRGTSVGPVSPPACATVPTAAASASATDAAPVTSEVPAPTSAAPASAAPTVPETPLPGSVAVPPASVPTPVVPPASGSVATSASETTPASETASTSETTPATGTTFAAGAHIAVLAVYPVTDVDPQGRAAQRRDTLQAQFPDRTVAVLASADHPGLTLGAAPVVNDSYIVYVGPFASPAEVTAFCATGSGPSWICLDAQPVPAR
ncbi:hypothetical protein [Nakamurella deserti]|uniref:COG1470 family protein n=1 Tax=Nakamurella deserti TaxID=2164074 RepID=UPI000DBE49AD|nr:hypothetical protein [Nakamurella deserti]